VSATHASGPNHTLISDRLPDPAQFARCYRILHTLVACEGSHSSRQKVTDITRRTVYLIQSGRKPPVSCRSAGETSPQPCNRVASRRFANLQRCAPRVRTLQAGAGCSTFAVSAVRRNTLCSNGNRQRIAAVSPLVNASHICDPKAAPNDECGGEEALSWRRGDAPSSSLTEKSVSTYRSLDNTCCVYHTVVYLIRYAIL
jgi:hypothetical protein